MSGEVADGALPLLFPPESYPRSRAEVVAGLAAAGRDITTFDLPACVWVSVGDPGPARRALAEKIAYFGSSFSAHQLAAVGLSVADMRPAAEAAFAGDLDAATAMIDDRMLDLGMAGSPEQVVARCAALAAQGADHLSFGPPLGSDPVAALRLLGTEVVPQLRTLPAADVD